MACFRDTGRTTADVARGKQAAFEKVQVVVTRYFETYLKEVLGGFEKEGKDLFKLLRFGSTYLGTDDYTSDLDLVLCTYAEVVVNKAVVKVLDHDNGTFFYHFFDFLENQPEIEKVIKVEEAQVPLIKIEIEKIEIDLLLCSKKSYASDLGDQRDAANRKSFASI